MLIRKETTQLGIMGGANTHMHWTAGLRFSFIFHMTGPPPVM
jgi:hypothetical protein